MQKRKSISTFSIVVFSLCLFIIPAITGAKGATYYVRSDGNDDSSGISWETAKKTIQQTISTANNGDTIIVGSSGGHGDGVYTENVNVNKSLIIKSESGYATTTVVAADTSDHVFEITVSNVTIGGEDCGFSIYGATRWGNAGIYLVENANGCVIQENRCGWDSTHTNYYGIYFSNSYSNTIVGNTANFNISDGIYINQSKDDILTDNICNFNGQSGLYIYYSTDNILRGNTLSGNRFNLRIDSGDISQYIHDIDASNLVEGKPIYYWVNQHDKQIPPDAGYVGVVNSNNITVKDLTIKNNMQGIIFAYTTNSRIENVDVSDNNDGIYLSYSYNNTIIGNTAHHNNNHGIYFEWSNNNTVTNNICEGNNSCGIQLSFSSMYNTITNNTCQLNQFRGISLSEGSNKNTFTQNTIISNEYQGINLNCSNNNIFYLNNLSNTKNFYCFKSNNFWHSPTPIFYHYSGGGYHKNYLGNYYSDYTGADDDGDGIGNSVYSISGMTDDSPLMATSDNYSLQAWWLNSDSKMYKDDMSKTIDSVAIGGGSSHIWITDQATLMNIEFSGGDTWTGQIAFTSAPASGHVFTVEIGSSINGSDFNTGGPTATITGDGSDSVFTYQTNASAFTVPEGDYLALRITNNSSSSYAVQTGGAWSYCSAPNGSQDYSLPVELASFTATPGNGIVTLKWLTESEIENLGFNIYRSTSRDSEFVMLNAKLIAGAGSSSERHEYSYIDRDVKSGLTYWYKLEDVDYNGKVKYHGPISVVLGNTPPTEFCLHKNYPNPFNPVTTISYDLAKDVYVELSVYNMLGEKVITLVNGNQPAGSYQLEWDGRDSRGLIVSSGMYLLRINAGNYCKTNKMVFVR